MSELLEAYHKLDHTCCLNSSTMKYGIITDNETDRDCKDIEEMTDCLDDLENVVKAFEIIKEKQIDIYIFLKTKSLDEYNEWYVGVQDDFIPLTENEYKLVIEMYNKYKSRR